MMDRNKIVTDNALDFVYSLQDGCIDMIFIDPPYGELEYMDKERIHEQFERVCPNGQIAVYGTPRLKGREFWVDEWKQLIPWIKPISTKPAVLQMPEFMEHLLFYRRVRMETGYHWSQYTGVLTGRVLEKEVWLVEPSDEEPEGELFYWVKPLEDIERIIRLYTKSGDTVLDCFAGSGTVLQACQNLDRVFVGCDINPRWATHQKDKNE